MIFAGKNAADGSQTIVLVFEGGWDIRKGLESSSSCD